MTTSRQSALIALGGNMPSQAGDLAQTVKAGLARLEELAEAPLLRSSLYHTPCFPVGAGPDYINAAARLEFSGTARQLLDILHQIEAEFGRERIQRWGQRTLDLDLIALGDTVLPDVTTQTQWRTLPVSEQINVTPDELILPHPRLQDRAFVLVPLADVAPEWVHPLLGLSVAQMLANIPASAVAEVVPITSP